MILISAGLGIACGILAFVVICVMIVGSRASREEDARTAMRRLRDHRNNHVSHAFRK